MQLKVPLPDSKITADRAILKTKGHLSLHIASALEKILKKPRYRYFAAENFYSLKTLI